MSYNIEYTGNSSERSINLSKTELSDFTVIVGNNGSGKTTLINLIQQYIPSPRGPSQNNFKSNLNRGEIVVISKRTNGGNSVLPLNQEEQFKELIDFFIQEGKERFNITDFDRMDERGYKSSFASSFTHGQINIILHKIEEVAPEIKYQDLKDRYYEFELDRAGSSDLFVNFSTTFGVYSSFLTQKAQELSLKKITQQEFDDLLHKDAPWIRFSALLEEFGLPFSFHVSDYRNIGGSRTEEIHLISNSTQQPVNASSLSEGEKVLFTMLQNSFSIEYGRVVKPKLVVMDELDANLDSDNTVKYLEYIQKIFLDNDIKVLLTTHSPITVGLLPTEADIREVQIHDGQLILNDAQSKTVVLKRLLKNIKNITVNLFESKEVFAEGSADRDYYATVLNILQTSMVVNPQYHVDTNSPIQFLSTGQNGDQSDCIIVKDLVSSFRRGGKQSVFGIVDWDGTRSSTEEVFVLGKNQRYAIDNYLLDPVVIIYLIIESGNRRGGVAKSINDKLETLGIVSSQTLVQIQNSDTLQKVVDIYFDTLCSVSLSVFSAEEIEEKITIKYVNGLEIKVPKQYLHIKGHILYGRLQRLEGWGKLFNPSDAAENEYVESKKWYAHVTNNILKNIPGFIDVEVAKLFKKITEQENTASENEAA